MALPIRTGGGSSARRSALRTDYLEIVYLTWLAVFGLAAWVGLTAAELGLDRPAIVLGVAAIILIAALVAVFRVRWQPIDPGSVLGLLPSLLVGALLYFPPDEWILGALDPGSYVNAGAAIATTGSILLDGTLPGALDPAIRARLFPAPASRLPGFYLMFLHLDGILPGGFAVSPDRVVPHGFHLYPAVLAFGYALGGIPAELLVTPLLALAALVGGYLFVRRLFGTLVAAIATLLLALSPTEVWFARYPAAEILTQVLLLGSFLALVAALDATSRPLAALAGFSLGLVHLAKIEMIFLPLLVLATIGYQACAGRRDLHWRWLVLPYAALLLQATLHALLIANWYTVTTVRDSLSPNVVLVGGSGVAVAASLAATLRWRPDLRCRLAGLLTHPRWEQPVSLLAPAAIGALALYAYYIRPLGSDASPTGALDDIQLALTNNLQSFVRLGWFMTPLGLLLGTLGWMLIAYHERNRRAAFPLLVMAVETLIFLDEMRITPIYYWAARRWVPLIIPGFCLATAYLLVYLLPRQRSRIVDALVPIACGIVVLAGLVGRDRPLLGYVEYRGAIQQLEQLAHTFPANSVVLFADGDAGQRFSVPLQYLFQRTSVLVPDDRSAEQAASQAARAWLAQGRPVFWVTTPDDPDLSVLGLRGRLIGTQVISLPEKRGTQDRPPGEDGLFRQVVQIWELTEARP